MREKIMRVLAWCCHMVGITFLFYKLNSRAKRIITFHNVLPDGIFRNDLANGVSISESGFAKIIDEIAEVFRFSADVMDPKTCTISFDDGYFNQYSTAFKILSDRKIPAMLFISGKILDSSVPHQALNIDKALFWTSYIPGGGYMLMLDKEILLEVDETNRLRLWVELIWPLFNEDGANKGDRLIEAMDAAYPFGKIFQSLDAEYLKQRMTGVSRGQIEEMLAAGWKVGWHTQSHYPLSKLSEEEMRKELTPPPEFAGEVLSYPYGEDMSVTEREIKYAESIKYPAAVSNTNSSRHNRSKFFLPRMALQSDKYMLHFELSGLKHFLKHGRLLPVVEAKR